MVDYTGKVAAVIIPRTREEEEFLVARRNDNGDWEFPGGKEDREKDEDLLETGEREIEEEFQLRINAEEAKPYYSWNGGGFEIVPVYATHGYEDLETRLEKSEMTDHSHYAWILAGDLGENLENAEEKLGEELNALEAFNLL